MTDLTTAPFFVVGFQRSGTTLLASLLDRHPDIAVPPETHFLDRSAASLAFVDDPLEKARVSAALHANSRLEDLSVDIDGILRGMESERVSLQEVFVAILRTYADNQGKQFVGEKTPAHIHHVDILQSWYPAAKIVWVVRDGRDVVLSLKRAPWTHESVRRHAVEWAASMRRMRRIAQGNRLIVTVRYEDLLQEPRRELERIHAHLEIPFLTRQLDVGETTNVVPEWETSWKGKVGTRLDLSRIGAWKKEAPRAELELMMSVMRSELEYFGYDTDCGATGVVGRLRHRVVNAAYKGTYFSPLTPLLRRIRRLCAPLFRTSGRKSRS